MSSFKNVFDVTWKVLLSLLIIAAILSVVYLVLTKSARVARMQEAARESTARFEQESKKWDTSDYHTRMPKSLWDRRVEWAIEHHCHFAGMSKDEIVKALGQPTDETSYSLTYGWPTKDCARYDGDTCVEYKKEERIFFLQNGYGSAVNYSGDGCVTMALGLDLDVKVPSSMAEETKIHAQRKQARLAQQANEREQREAEAASWQTKTGCENDGFIWKDGACVPRE